MKWYIKSGIMYGIEVWRLDKAWKELDKICSRFCKKVINMLNCAAGGFVEMELCTESRSHRCVGQIVKY